MCSLFFVICWALFFILMMPLLWHLGTIIYEAQLQGDMSPTFPPIDRLKKKKKTCLFHSSFDRCAMVTLVATSSYVRGARVLGHTLNVHNVRSFPLVALTVGLTKEEDKSLQEVGWQTIPVDPIPFHPPGVDREKWRWVPAAKLGKAHVNALTKMRVWNLEQFDRIVFVDSDAWAVGDVSELCKRQEEVVVMHYAGKDINSGVMPLKPSKKRFEELMDFWRDHPDKFFIYNKKRQARTKELTNPDQR